MDGRSLHLTPLRHAAVGALLVFALGFGVMNAFWLIGSWDTDLLGLYDFKSATLGDGLVLPILAFLLIRTGRWHELWSRRVMAFIAICGVLAGTIGLLMQISWLNAPGTTLNWTIPEPGVFNSAGCYHAVFLVVTMAVFAVLIVRSAIALRMMSGPVPAIWKAEGAALLICTPLFPALWSLDFLSATDGAGAVLRAIAWTLILPPLCLAVVRPNRWRPYLMALLAAEVVVVAVSVVVVFAPSLDMASTMMWLAIAIFAPNFAIPLWRECSRATSVLGCLAMLASGVAVGILASELSATALQWAVLATIGVLMAWALVLVAISVDSRTNLLTRKHVVVESIVNCSVLVGVVLFGLFVASKADNRFADGIFLVWSLMVLGGITFEKMLFREQVRAEDSLDNVRHQTERIRVFQWGLLGLTAVLVILVLNEMTLSSSLPVEHVSVALKTQAVSAFILVHIAAIVLMAAVIGVRNATGLLLRRVIVTILGVVMLSATSILMRETWLALAGAQRQGVIVAGLTIPTVGLLAFIVLSVASNVYHLRGKRVPSLHRLAAFGVGLVVATTTWGCLSIILMSTGAAKLLAGAILIGVIMLPVAVVHATTSEDLTRYFVKASPRQGLFQDASLAVLLCAVVVGYPTYNLLTHDELESVLVRSVAVLGLVAGLYGWMLANNVEHAAKYLPARSMSSVLSEVRSSARPEDNDPLVEEGGGPRPLTRGQLHRRVRRHTRLQNTISAFMLIPVVPYLLATLNVEEVGLALLATDPGDSNNG